MRWFLLSLIAPLSVWGAEAVGVVVSIPPQAAFVERVGGARVDVTVMVQPSESPHTYEPRPRQMLAVKRARVYFSVGVGFERTWLPRLRATNRRMAVVATAAGIEKRQIEAHDHGHDHGHDEDEGSPDPHVWLAPPLVKQQAVAIRDGLIAADPAGAATYRKRCEAFLKELDALHAKLQKILAEAEPPHNAFMVFHPSWGYFADTYGLRQIPIEVGGREPSLRQLREVFEAARQARIRAIFVQPQFPQTVAERVAKQVGAEVVPADPLARDWRDNLLQVARRIAETMPKAEE